MTHDAGSPPDAVLLAILRAERRPHAPEELSERTGLPVNTVKRALGKLVTERHVRRAGGGKFAASSHPPRG